MGKHKPSGGYPWDLSDPEWIDMQEVSTRVALPVNTIYALARGGGFPKQTRMGPCVSRWRASEVERWLKDHPPESRNPRKSRRDGALENAIRIHERKQSAKLAAPKPKKRVIFQGTVEDTGDSTVVRFLPIKEVVYRVSLSKTEIYKRMKENRFPQRLLLSVGRVAWLESEVDGWMDSLVAQHRETK